MQTICKFNGYNSNLTYIIHNMEQVLGSLLLIYYPWFFWCCICVGVFVSLFLLAIGLYTAFSQKLQLQGLFPLSVALVSGFPSSLQHFEVCKITCAAKSPGPSFSKAR